MPSCLSRPGFTLIELLVTIGIIVILIGILLPVVASVRKAAFVTSTKQEMATIGAACQAYYQDFRAYPGPIAQNDIDAAAAAAVAGSAPVPPTQIPPTFALLENITGTPAVTDITSSENLVLGLSGGVYLSYTTATPPAVQNWLYDFTSIGKGPQVLNVLLNMQKQTTAYFTPKPEELPPGDPTHGYQEFGTGDSYIPEYLDHIPGNITGPPGSPISGNGNYNFGPILYLRARVGATQMLYEGTGTAASFQYNFQHLFPYSFSPVAVPSPTVTTGVSQTDFPLPSPNPPTGTTYTYDYADVYIANPAFTLPATGEPTPKGKDTFLLISAGADRIFGTKDDIISSN